MVERPIRKFKNLLARIADSVRGAELSSERYWEGRYRRGGDSGAGSYGRLREFKAEVLNRFVSEHRVEYVIEFGCGDGSQLSCAEYPLYAGYDVSSVAVDMCRKKFETDATKTFDLMADYDGRKADLCLSLDVIFHLVEDGVFESYMKTLFGASNRHVIIYSSNTAGNNMTEARHVRHRKITDWIEDNIKHFKLVDVVENKYPYDGNYEKTSFSNFYFYRITDETGHGAGV